MKKFMAILLCVFFASSIQVNASENTYITNINGIKISEEQYHYLLNFYTENSIMNMTKEKFESEMNRILTPKEETQKYIKTITYFDSQGISISNDYEVSEQEYNNPIVLYSNCEHDLAVACWETTYKKLYMVIWGSGSGNQIEFERIVLINDWKVMPSVRSYDVIGVRFYNWQLTNAWGDQSSISSNEGVNTTEYSYGGANMNIQSNGVGISQNLYNFSSTYSLTNRIVVEGNVLSNHIGRYGSYQHATRDVTLAQSKNYSFGNGLGDVFVFNSGIGSYYDGMQGVSNVY